MKIVTQTDGSRYQGRNNHDIRDVNEKEGDSHSSPSSSSQSNRNFDYEYDHLDLSMSVQQLWSQLEHHFDKMLEENPSFSQLIPSEGSLLGRIDRFLANPRNQARAEGGEEFNTFYHDVENFALYSQQALQQLQRNSRSAKSSISYRQSFP